MLRGLVDLIPAVTRSLPVATAALGLFGVGTCTGMVTFNSLRQAEVLSETRLGARPPPRKEGPGRRSAG